MQLPRGTFREIRKIVAIGNLLADLETEKFTGIAGISSQTLTGTLVFKAGKCILVKFRTTKGDAAWEELQKAAGEEVDAALSVLGDAQIELALEFNKQFRTSRTGKPPSVAHARAGSAGTHEAAPAIHPPRTAVPVAPLKPPVKPAPVRHSPAPPQVTRAATVHSPPPHPPPFAKIAVPVPPAPPVAERTPPQEERPSAAEPESREHETGGFETDLDTFDTMDFDSVTDKIRTDCKTMIKQLHLDHLMER